MDHSRNGEKTVKMDYNLSPHFAILVRVFRENEPMYTYIGDIGGMGIWGVLPEGSQISVFQNRA